jgi:hypothetical protein
VIPVRVKQLYTGRDTGRGAAGGVIARSMSSIERPLVSMPKAECLGGLVQWSCPISDLRGGGAESWKPGIHSKDASPNKHSPTA